MTIVGRRGLVGLFVMYNKSHGAKGWGIESWSFSFFFQSIVGHTRQLLAKTNVIRETKTFIGRTITMWILKTRERRWLRTEEEKPAGISGTKQYTTKEDGSDEAIQSD